MLSREDNELLCRVGPGTPTGNLLRQYWIPALLSSELPESDGPPVRLRLLGEDLIAFRDTQARVGMLDHHCQHRGASLFFGRNEEGGLRCVYHGWKYDVSGQCIDMPNEPPESNFKDRIRTTAYPCQERGGVIWTYMGPRPVGAAKGDPNVPVDPLSIGPVGGLPPLPDLEPNMQPEGATQVSKVFRECNWFQGLEGDIDTSHFGFLHMGKVQPEDAPPGSFDYYTVKERAPRYHCLDTEYGTMYGAYRPADADTYYWRMAAFLFPFFTMIPPGALGVQIMTRAWVPLDDEHLMFWSMGTRRPSVPAENPDRADRRGQAFPGTSAGFRYLPDTSDWLGKWRLAQNRTNDYLIDRKVQRTGSFTGVEGIHAQDQMITESMGPIYDRTREHLGASDTMVVRTRARMLAAVKAFRDRGELPPGVDHPEVYRERTGSIVLPRGADWLADTKGLRTPAL